MYFNVLDELPRVGTAVALSSDQTTNPNTEDSKMRTDGQTIRGNEMVIPHVDLEAVKEWVKRSFSEDNVTKACLAMAGALSICYWAARTYQAFQAY
jgi:hypothetical protein